MSTLIVKIKKTTSVPRSFNLPILAILVIFGVFTSVPVFGELPDSRLLQTACMPAIEKLYIHAQNNCQRAKFKDEEKDKTIKEWKSARKAEEDQVTWDEYCRGLAKEATAQAKSGLESFQKDSATAVEFSCGVGSTLDEDFRSAFELQSSGLIDVLRLKLKECPLHRYFWTGDLRQESFTKASVACSTDQKLQSIGQRVSGDYFRFKTTLSRKYGEPVRMWTQLSRLARRGSAETHQVNVLYKKGSTNALLINNARAKTSRITDLILSGKTVETKNISLQKLELSEESTIYEFTQDLLTELQKDQLEAKKFKGREK